MENQAGTNKQKEDTSLLQPGNSSLQDLVKMYFSAYETQNREMIESLLHDDFMFSSPEDDRISRHAYLELCWPFSKEHPSYELQRMMADKNEIVVVYNCRIKSNMEFRNAELICFDGIKIRRIEVFFGKNVG